MQLKRDPLQHRRPTVPPRQLHAARATQSSALGEECSVDKAMPMIDSNQVWGVQEEIEYVHHWRRSSPGVRICLLQFNWGVRCHL